MRSKTTLWLTIAVMVTVTMTAGVATAVPATTDASPSLDDHSSVFGNGFLDVNVDGGLDDCKWNQTFKYCEPEEPDP